MNKIKIGILLLVLIMGFFLRFYKLGEIPAGLYTDEAALGYDAYSLMLTGNDQYGKHLPIFLKSFGDFKSPLYSYLTIIPIYFFGLSAFSVRFISALSGLILIWITFVILFDLNKRNFLVSIIGAFIITISPWSVFFSRHALEANLGIALLSVSILFFILSLKRSHFFIFACLFLGISTYAYHSERFFSFIFLLFFIFMFRKKILKHLLLFGVLLFLLLQIPQMSLIHTAGFNIRIDQVNYWNEEFFIQNGGGLRGIFFGKWLFIVREFLSQYFAYFSPKNIFFNPDSQVIRSMPNLSIYYSWLLVPFLFGLKEIWRLKKDNFFKVLILIILISPIPAALTRDPFYTIRALPLFWSFSFVIVMGINRMLNILSNIVFKVIFSSMFILISFLTLYSSYFVLFKFERSNDYGFSYIELVERTVASKDEQFIIDTGRVFGSYIYFAFYKKYDPLKMQEFNRSKLKDYYNSVDFEQMHIIDNVVIKPILWNKDLDKKSIIVGDTLAISEKQAKEHNLTPVFEINDLNNKVYFKAYLTHPELNKRL